MLFVDSDGRDFGIRIDHVNKTIIIEANYYYQNQHSLDKNRGSLEQWNSLGAKYTTADGVEYSVSFNMNGIVAGEDQNVQDLASDDPIGNSVKELSDNGFKNWVFSMTREDIDIKNHGGGTVLGRRIVNRKAVANDKTRTHEMGHTLGLDDNTGGVMDYAESFDKMSNANYTNTKSILKSVYNQVKSDRKSLNSNGTNKTETLGKANYRIIVSGDYSGSKGFLKPKNLRDEE